MDVRQEIIDALIDHIDKAIKKGSVTNQQVAAVLDFLNEKLKAELDIELLQTMFLRKDQEDGTNFLLRLLGGLQVGEYTPGLIGAMIDKYGNAEMRSLILNGFLEVPELRYNRTEISVGNKWRAPGAGIIESVDTENHIITLKLEDGEIGAIALGDICMGIFHSLTPADNSTEDSDDSKGNFKFAGFATVYFRVSEILETGRNSRFRYQLRPTSDSWPLSIHPFEAMHFAVYGNFIDHDRQTSVYETRTYTRMLWKQDDWEISAKNIAMQYGDMSNLSIHGLNMDGYSLYANNIYMTGVLKQVKADGTIIKVIEDRGEWVAGEHYDNQADLQSDVWLFDCRWRCIVDGTTEMPGWNATDWQFISGNSKLSLSIDSSSGLFFRGKQLDTTLVSTVYKGSIDITNLIADGEWVWTRDSGNPVQDAAWNAQHTSDVGRLELTSVDLGDNWWERKSVTFTCTAYYRDGSDVFSASADLGIKNL